MSICALCLGTMVSGMSVVAMEGNDNENQDEICNIEYNGLVSYYGYDRPATEKILNIFRKMIKTRYIYSANRADKYARILFDRLYSGGYQKFKEIFRENLKKSDNGLFIEEFGRSLNNILGRCYADRYASLKLFEGFTDAQAEAKASKNSYYIYTKNEENLRKKSL